MKNVQGFTLLEMIVTIVIIGILTVTAAPHFIDMAKEARISTLKGAQNVIASADCLVYGKSALNDTHKLPLSNVVIEEGIDGEDDVTVDTIYGHFINTKSNLSTVANLNGYSVQNIKSSTFNDKEHNIKYTIVTLTPKGEDDSFDLDDLSKCYVKIEQNKNGTLKFDLITDEC